MKKTIISIIILVITIGLSGCMVFKKTDKGYEKVKAEALKTLEEKYGEEFAELEVVSTTSGPIAGTSYDVVFETYPLNNKDLVFSVNASSKDGSLLSDTYFWYLVEDEYSDLLNSTMESVLLDSNAEYFYYFVNDERKMFGDEVSGETTLYEALEKKLIKIQMYVFVYRDGLEKEEFINIGNGLVEALKGVNSSVSLTLRSALDEDSYKFLKENAEYGSNGLSPYFYMSYTFGDTMDLTKEYGFRYVNDLRN